MSDSPFTPPVLSWGAATHPGKVRVDNEDAFVAEPMVFAVADGMGGHQAGEVASAIAADTMRDRLSGGAASVGVVIAAVVEANAAIFQGAHTNAGQRGMGTTLTALAALTSPTGPTRLVLANVGDSRTYLYRGGRLRRATVDHSYVQELVNTGHITEYEARSHPRRNIVTRALGIEPTLKVDTWVVPLALGDRFVLCSDGLVDEVADEEIAQLLSANAQPQAAAEALVAAANANGGRDNVTVVVVDVLDGEAPQDDTADLVVDVDEDWDDEPDRLIDAEAGTASAHEVGGSSPETTVLAAAAAATVANAADGSYPARRSVLGRFLFALGLATIATVTVVLVLVVRHNANDEPAPTTTTSSTTSTSTTTTSTTTTTTTPSTTAAPTTGT